jgi:tetratricopeptide (TPR) repeat protein
VRPGPDALGRKLSRYGILVAVAVGLVLVAWGALTGLSDTAEYVAQGSASARMQAAQTASRLAPWRPGPLEIQAQLLEANGSPKALVVRALDRLIALAPHGYTYYVMKAQLLADQPQQVIETTDQGLQVYPASVRLKAQRALAQAQLGDFASAERDAAAAWSVARDVVPAYREPSIGISYAQVLLLAGKQAEAKAVLGELLADFPGNADVARLQTAIDAAKK